MKYLLLIVPCVLCLLVPLYNRIEPTLAGIPFFYWSLMLLIPLSAGFIWLAAKTDGSDA